MLTPKIKHIAKSFLYLFSIILFSLAILRINWMLSPESVLEAGLLSVLILIFVAQKPVHLFIQAIPRPHMNIFLVFFFLMMSAHLIEKEKTTFPFLTWGMYSRSYSKPHIEYFEYIGTTVNDVRIDLHVDDFYPALTHSGMYSKLAILVGKATEDVPVGTAYVASKPRGIKRITTGVIGLFAGTPLEKDQARKILNDILVLIAGKYNRQNPTAPLKSIDAVLVRRDLELSSQANMTRSIKYRIQINP